MVRIVSAALIVLLVGCGGPVETWRHRGGKVAEGQLQRAKADCHMYLDASRQEGSLVLHKRPVFEWEDEFVQCMAERGWYLERVR